MRTKDSDFKKSALRFDENDNGPMTAFPRKMFAEDNSLLIPPRTVRLRARRRAGYVVVH